MRRPLAVTAVLSKRDLGAVPELFGSPERYARFLGGEISSATTASSSS